MRISVPHTERHALRELDPFLDDHGNDEHAPKIMNTQPEEGGGSWCGCLVICIAAWLVIGIVVGVIWILIR